jgi:hypothetical protein
MIPHSACALRVRLHYKRMDSPAQAATPQVTTLGHSTMDMDAVKLTFS